MTLDFTTQLHSFVDQLDLPFPITVGALDVEDSISLYALPGGKTIREFYNGIADKELNYEFGIKTKDQALAIKTLDMIAHALFEADIPSGNDSYEFRGIQVSSEPFLAQIDEHTWMYQLMITAELTVYK